MTIEDRINSVKTRARELFEEEKYNCAEASFLALNEILDGGLAPQAAARIATGLGGGLGATGGTCGALTGSVMALGLLAEGEAGPSRKKTIYPLAKDLQNSFKQKYSTCCCRELTREMGKDRRKQCAILTGEIAGQCAALLLKGKDTE